jgi:glycosyltransferase involved in cell wall biosynthesis
LSEGHPRVTVGVAVFNGESFLAKTLESLLNQTFSDFEVVISDNASTDQTEEICRAYAARDTRVRYYREFVNHGAAWNHNRVFELARGEYFKWNSADDLCAPEFLARCVAALDEDASATMVCSNVLVIDDYGDPVKPGIIPAEVASRSALQRFRRTIQSDHYCLHIYSLIRSDILRQTDLLGYFNGSDRVLLSQLSLFGPCVLLPDTLLFNRDHPGRFIRSFAWQSREGAVWFDRSAAKRKLFPGWETLGGFREVISRSPLRWRERLQCYGMLLAWIRYHKELLLDDLLYYPRVWLARHVSRATVNREGSRATGSVPQPSAAAQDGSPRPGSRALATEAARDSDSTSITVILCTGNRCQDLARTLESVAASKMPNTATWEVLVVDNNSTDQTREVVDDFCRRYPGRFRYLFEPKPGKAYALNSGVANARGEVLAFVDDDVTVEPRWLRHLTAELRGGEWAGTAGRILPARAITPPPWLSWKHCGGILCGYFDLGNHPSELDLDHAPHGANMAFRRAIFERHGGFRVGLGPGPQRLPNGDTEFGRRLMKAGERLRYEPSAVVYHPVAQDRITKEYFLSWWFDYGRAYIIERGDRPDVLGIPRDYISVLLRVRDISMMGLREVFAIHAAMRFFWKCMVWKQAGMLVGLYQRLLSRKATNATSLS